jgi:hypothetical protein
MFPVIVKDKDDTQADSKRLRAGIEAEKQMAFYLRRKFGEDDAVFVLNDIRLTRGDEVAQIDHLVVHKYGMIIIESKSVTGEIRVNAQEEWVRTYGRKRTGMPSPVRQAERQGELLQKLLQDNRKNLREKMLFGMKQGGFQNCPIQILVAISDQGIIKRGRKPIPELYKADQIADEVVEIIKRHRKGGSLIGGNAKDDGKWGNYIFKDSELQKVVQFLKDWHSPATGDA